MLDVSYIYIYIVLYISIILYISDILYHILCSIYIHIYCIYNIYILYVIYCIYISGILCYIAYIHIYILRSVYRVPFEKLALPIGGSPNRKKWPERGSVTSVRANILTLGRTDNFPAMCDGPGPQFLDFKVVFNVLGPITKYFLEPTIQTLT